MMVFFRWHADLSGDVCPDCAARNGQVKTMAEWTALGLPGTGATRCGAYCRCYLEAVRQVKGYDVWVKISEIPYWLYVFERIHGTVTPEESAKRIEEMEAEKTETTVEKVTEGGHRPPLREGEHRATLAGGSLERLPNGRVRDPGDHGRQRERLEFRGRSAAGQRAAVGYSGMFYRSRIPARGGHVRQGGR